MDRRLFLSGLAAVAILGAMPAASAQGFPEAGKTIRVIVPFPAGGGTDAFARLLTPIMSKTLGAPIDVVNKPGASSQVGLTELVNSPADGYTLSFIIFPTSLAYLDPGRGSAYTRSDFTPIGPAFEAPSVVAVRADSKYKTLKDLVDEAKAKKGVVTAGTPGVMSTGHLAALGFQKATGTELALVNFQGGAPNLTALLGGHVNASFIAMNEALPQLESKGGQIRVVAVLDQTDNPYGLPTAKSQGFDVPSFAPDVGLVGPDGIPPATVAKLSQALHAALTDAEVKKKAVEVGNALRIMTPAEYEKHWVAAEEKYKPLVAVARGK